MSDFTLNDRTLDEWHHWLTHDAETGEDLGNLRAPCSRYGRNGAECAHVAIALEWITVHANGPSDDPEASLDYLMGLVVNDSDDPAELIASYGYALPEPLRWLLGEDWCFTSETGRIVPRSELIRYHDHRGMFHQTCPHCECMIVLFDDDEHWCEDAPKERR